MSPQQVRRRRGDARLSEAARQRTCRFAASSSIAPPVKVAFATKVQRGAVKLDHKRWKAFFAWYEGNACASERSVARGPALRRSLALLGRAKACDRLWALLCFWRIDNVAVWDEVEDDVLARKWPAVLLTLRREQQVHGAMQASTHQTYVDRAMQVPGPEQHVAFMRHWDNAAQTCLCTCGSLRQRAVTAWR